MQAVRGNNWDTLFSGCTVVSTSRMASCSAKLRIPFVNKYRMTSAVLTLVKISRHNSRNSNFHGPKRYRNRQAAAAIDAGLQTLGTKISCRISSCQTDFQSEATKYQVPRQTMQHLGPEIRSRVKAEKAVTGIRDRECESR